MRFYRVAYFIESGSSNGYSWHSAMTEARRTATAYWHEHPQERRPDIKPVDITPTKTGILNAFNHYASHEQNG